MATKTVVCPDCGSATPLGRYTCAECGAFLDATVAPPRRTRERSPRNAAAATGSAMPDRAPDAGPAADGLPSAAGSLPDDGLELEPVDPTAPLAADRAPEVQWPASAFEALPPPPVRVPAGSWLPPSAHLTGLEEPAVPGSGTAAAALPGAAPAAAAGSTGLAAFARDWLAALGTPERRWASARRTIAIGSVVALFGFLLPWGNGPVASLLSVWLSVWGLALPGTWLIVFALVALGGVAVMTGRAESLPLGIPAIALASLELGLIWSALFGAAARPIGILVVFAGAIVLAVGGMIELGARHEAATPDV